MQPKMLVVAPVNARLWSPRRRRWVSSAEARLLSSKAPHHSRFCLARLSSRECLREAGGLYVRSLVTSFAARVVAAAARSMASRIARSTPPHSTTPSRASGSRPRRYVAGQRSLPTGF